jgi:uncharacterized protein
MNAYFEAVLVAAFMGGLAGGVHCAGMCGGIVHALCAVPGGKTDVRHLIGYNVGRMASYMCAGALAGALGQAGLLTRAAPLLQPVMFALASLMLVMLGLYLAGVMPLMARIEAAGAWLWRGISPLTRRMLPVTSMSRALGLGALWGWLPCGMVYAVLLSALAMGRWWQGALVMLAFGLGTLPNLLGIGMLTRRINRLQRAGAPRAIAGVAITLFGVYGVVKIMQPGVLNDDGLLCYIAPGLIGLLP